MFKKILFLILLPLSFFLETAAQVYHFKKYTTSDGLVQGTVKAIYQDSKGRMWFGTAEGVSIYDGTEFFNYGIAEGFTRPVITSFFEITPGIMLVGTLGDGLVVFSDPSFSRTIFKTKITNAKYFAGRYISQIIPDQNGNIWIVSDDGITVWKMQKYKLVAAERIDTFGVFGNPAIYQMEFYDDKNFYLATDIGLIKKNDSAYELVKYKGVTINKPVFKLFKDSKGTIWFSTHHDLYYIMNDEVHNAVEIHNSLKEAIYCFTEDEDHNLYFGTIEGIIELNGSNINSINKENGLDSKDIISLFHDTENNLWIGSLSGVSKLTSSNFKFVRSETFKGHFTNIIRDEKKLYVTSNEGLFEVKNYVLIKSESGKGIKSETMRHIYKDKNGYYWFSTEDGVFRRNQNSIIQFTEKDGLPHNFIYQIAVDTNNVAWIATQRGLAYIKSDTIYDFDNHSEKKWIYSDDLAQQLIKTQSIRRVIVDDENSIWVGPWDGGLFRIKDNIVYRFTQKDGLLDLNIRGIQIDVYKNIWVSTRYGGAFKFDGKTFLNYSTKNGLKSNWVFSVETDYNQNLWFCTANGLTKHDGYKSINFDASDGIISAEIISSAKFGGKLWFVSNSQIFSYEPEERKNDFNYPRILFKEIKLIDGNLPLEDSANFKDDLEINSIIAQTQTISKTVILEHFQNSLVFDFVGIDFGDESKITYEYILEGFDNQWTRNTRLNYLTYTHLPPGKYSFKVNAINKEGIKSLSPAVFNFEILIPFWQRWWFLTISVLFFVLLVSLANYLIYQYKIRQALKLERMRSKISIDLHDEIGTSLSSIAIFAELVKRETTGRSPKVIDMLERIQNTSRELIENMNDIVWTINPGNDRFEDALLKLKDYTVKILESRSIDVSLKIDTANVNTILPMDVRRNLLLIFKEIVTNAAKYSKASMVKINLRFEDKPTKKIILSIEDNGIGFDSDKIQPGYGLKNIKRRSYELKAKFNLNSSVGKGTCVSIEIPVE
jgi:ligand-binding sensor domain-containing protein/signal transduction histidine kinase